MGLMNIFKMVRTIVMSIINPFLQKIIFIPLRNLKKLPMKIASALGTAGKNLLGKKEQSLRDYVPIGQYYVSKRLLLILLLILLILGYLIYKYGYLVGEKISGYKTLYDRPGQQLNYTGRARVYFPDDQLEYIGDLAAGLYNGNGRLYYRNGRLEYQGSFVGSGFEGPGKLWYANGKLKFEGSFTGGSYAGQGKLYYRTGNLSYQGGFKDGAYEGPGKLWYQSGKLHYDGSFSAGLYNGPGKLYREDSSLLYEGNFTNGKYEGSGKLYGLNNQLVYEGSFASGLYSGEGTAYDSSGKASYTGTFAQGYADGAGKLLDPQGNTVYEGSFSEGERSGTGVAYDSAGNVVYKGYFKNDSPYYAGFLGATDQTVEQVMGGPSPNKSLLGTSEYLPYDDLHISFTLDYSPDQKGAAVNLVTLYGNQQVGPVDLTMAVPDIKKVLGKPLRSFRSQDLSVLEYVINEGIVDFYYDSGTNFVQYAEVTGPAPVPPASPATAEASKQP
jgi:antitoxin component YwqK of YwqJK toxin-antitoxin module